MPLSLIVSIFVFLMIAIRQWLPDWLKIWMIMTIGAVIVLASGSISPKEALNAIDWVKYCHWQYFTQRSVECD